MMNRWVGRQTDRRMDGRTTPFYGYTYFKAAKITEQRETLR